MTSIYSPLSVEKREIRLLHLLPGQPGDPLHCELKIASLELLLDYETLSYAWGDLRKAKKTVYVNGGQKFLATENLEAALRRLRLPDRYRTLWADAICINQLDFAEKNHQVAGMGEIYRRCREVIIWLGEITDLPFKYQPTSSLEEYPPWAIRSHEDYIKQHNTTPHIMHDNSASYLTSSLDIRGAFEILHLLASQKHLSEMPFYNITKFPEFELSKNWPYALQSLKNILSRQWFSRTWTVQEAILPPKATVMLSAHAIDWTVILLAARNFYSHSLTVCCCQDVVDLWSRSTPLQEQFSRISDLVRVTDSHRLGTDEKTEFSWWHLQRLAKSREVADPRDSIYALQGLFATTDHALPPEYALPVADIYSQATKRLIEEEGALDCLIFQPPLSEGGKRYGLPTWVIDWNYDGFYLLERYRYKTSAPFDSYSLPSAASSTRTLIIECVSLGTVSNLGPKIEKTVLPADQADAIRSLQDFAFNETHLDRDEFWDAIFMDNYIFWKIAMPDPDSYTMKEDDMEAILEWWEWCQQRTSIRRTDLPNSRINEIQSRLDETIWNPKVNVFSTSGGQFGISDGCIQPGDHIYIVKGSQVPLILRELSLPDGTRNFQYIGACYIHRCMYGEAITPESFWETLHLH